MITRRIMPLASSKGILFVMQLEKVSYHKTQKHSVLKLLRIYIASYTILPFMELYSLIKGDERLAELTPSVANGSL